MSNTRDFFISFTSADLEIATAIATLAKIRERPARKPPREAVLSDRKVPHF